jgi:signal transduction histidine kinase
MEERAGQSRTEGDPGSSGSAERAARAVRQLARLRFDLHDGPQQDLALLAEDLRMFGSQLDRALQGHAYKDRLVGHLDDLQARLVALDGDLRRITSMLESPFLQDDTFESALLQLVEAFKSRTELEPEVDIRGDFGMLSDSQQITLLALVREALNNIREHSDADRVWVEIVTAEGIVEVVIGDNGSGFEPEAALVRAAREGHLGIVGMHERVQMLGGSTKIDSKPGGPTIISARLPAGKMRWIKNGAAGV